MNISANCSSKCTAFLAAACVAVNAWAAEWSDSKPALYRGDIIVTYRARVVDGWLVVEAKHAPNWHTYAMDNLVRAEKASGAKTDEVEAPTQIRVGGGLKTAGGWKQSPPDDLSNQEIRWFTWGFANTARFAVKVEHVSDSPGLIVVNAQVCSDALCSFARDLELVVPTDGPDDTAEATGLLEGLIDVQTQL